MCICILCKITDRTDRKGITDGLRFNQNGFSMDSKYLRQMYLTIWQFSQLKTYTAKKTA